MIAETEKKRMITPLGDDKTASAGMKVWGSGGGVFRKGCNVCNAHHNMDSSPLSPHVHHQQQEHSRFQQHRISEQLMGVSSLLHVLQLLTANSDA